MSHTAAAPAAAAGAAAPAVAAAAAPAGHAGPPTAHPMPAPALAAQRHSSQTVAAAPGSRSALSRPLLRHRLARPLLPLPLLLLGPIEEVAAAILPHSVPQNPAARRCCPGAGLAAPPRCRCWYMMQPASAGSWGKTNWAAPPPPAASCRSTCVARSSQVRWVSMQAQRAGRRGMPGPACHAAVHAAQAVQSSSCKGTCRALTLGAATLSSRRTGTCKSSNER